MKTLTQFLAMGGYAAFVWPALAIAAGVMTGLLIQSIRSLRAREKELAKLGGDNEARRGSRS